MILSLQIYVYFYEYSSPQLENHGMIKTAVGIAKQEGVTKLWSGLLPMFQRHFIYSGCRLIFYEHFRDAFKDENGKVSLGVASVGEAFVLLMHEPAEIYLLLTMFLSSVILIESMKRLRM